MSKHIRQLAIIGILSTLMAAVAGCPKAPDLSPVIPDIKGVKPAVDYHNLATVLDKVVTRDGLLNAASLRANADALDEQLKLLAVTGPTVTPELFATDDARVAYWYNARAAWAMKLALLCECKPKVNHSETLQTRPFLIDGRQMTLAKIDDLLAGDSDWRTQAAAPGVSFDHAGLPEKPFTPENIRAKITERFNAYVGDQRRFVIDIENKRVLVPMGLWNIRDKLIASYETTYGAKGVNLLTALLPYLYGMPQQRVRDATGYQIEPRQPTGLIARLKRDF